MIEGYNSNGVKTGNIYKSYLYRDRFFKIPLGAKRIFLTKDITEHLYSGPNEKPVTGEDGIRTYPYPYPSIHYNLYYF